MITTCVQFSLVQFEQGNIYRLYIFPWLNEAVGNMKLFNNHSGLRGLPRFAEGIYWATDLSLTTPFTEGCAGALANKKASPPGRRQEQAPKQHTIPYRVALLAIPYHTSSTTGHYVQFSSVQFVFFLFLRSLYSKFSSFSRQKVSPLYRRYGMVW